MIRSTWLRPIERIGTARPDARRWAEAASSEGAVPVFADERNSPLAAASDAFSHEPGETMRLNIRGLGRKLTYGTLASYSIGRRPKLPARHFTQAVKFRQLTVGALPYSLTTLYLQY